MPRLLRFLLASSLIITLAGCGSTYSPDGYAGQSVTPRSSRIAYSPPEVTEYKTPLENRKGLGTRRGEWRHQEVSAANFNRASSSPSARIGIRYDDRKGIDAATGNSERWRARQFDCGPATVAITTGGSRSLPGYRTANGNYVVGGFGDRYEILIKNSSHERIEVVLSVDGLDVMDGKSASTRKRGYVVPPRGKVSVEGWRSSSSSVEAFRFGNVADSAAANRGSASSTRNVGVIGAAVFRERGGTQWGSERGYEAGRRGAANPFPEG